MQIDTVIPTLAIVNSDDAISFLKRKCRGGPMSYLPTTILDTSPAMKLEISILSLDVLNILCRSDNRNPLERRKFQQMAVTGKDEIPFHGRGTGQDTIVRAVGDDHGAMQRVWSINSNDAQVAAEALVSSRSRSSSRPNCRS